MPASRSCCGEGERAQAHGGVAHQRVGHAGKAHKGCEMAGRGVVDRLGKEERAGGAFAHDLVVEFPGVDDAAAADGENERAALAPCGKIGNAGIRQRGEAGGGGEVGDGAGAPQAGVAGKRVAGLRRHGRVEVRAPALRSRQFAHGRGRAGLDGGPHFRQAFAQRRDPARTGNERAQAAGLSSRMLAFVPPKPKEFESTRRSGAGPRLIRHDVQVPGGIGGDVVDIRRQHLLAEGEEGDNGFDRSRRSEGVAHHRFGGAHGHAIAEDLRDGEAFRGVVEEPWRCRAR